MTDRDSLALRRANAKDAEFAFRVLKETMREYVVATWGSLLRLVEAFRLCRFASCFANSPATTSM